MRYLHTVVSVALAACLAHTAGAQQRRYVALINAAQETGAPVASNAFGSGTFLIDTAANTLTYYIAYTGLTSAETAAHIHGIAAPGVPAGVIHPLPAGNPKVGVWNYPQANEADILAGRTYVNIHTANFGGGEIRGQIVTHVAFLDALQEVPPNPTPGSGFGLFVMDTAANTLSYYISFTGLSAAETAAHIHGIAGYGQGAGVIHPLPAGSPKVGVWNYPQIMERDICQGLTYANVHSANFGGGELRGQITAYVAPCDATQESGVASPGAAGYGFFSLSEATDRLGYDIRSGGLTTAETAAHIHGFAPRGVSVGVLHPLPPGPRKLGFWNYAAAQEANILAGLTYVNIHTAMFGGGEIRGQIEFRTCPCPADWNDDGTVNSQDFFDFLAAFFAGNSDFNGVDGTNSQDFFDFLAAFFTPCP